MIEGMDVHVGDGVYISFDGFQFWIAVNHHANRVVALPPETFDGLLEAMSTHPEFYRAMIERMREIKDENSNRL